MSIMSATVKTGAEAVSRAYKYASFGDTRLPARFWDKVSPEPNTGCWLWTASRNPAGYGQYMLVKKPVLAHRLVFGVLTEPLENGLQLDHLCRTRCCVNPLHLEQVSTQENTRRGVAGRANAAKTQCPRGHAYDAKNTYVGKSGSRFCSECHNISSRLRYAKRRRA